MSRTIIQISELLDSGDVVTVIEPPGTPAVMLGLNYAHAKISNYRACNGTGFVQEVGDFLSSHLDTLAGINNVLHNAIQAAARSLDHREVIAFELNSSQAEAVPWETLYAKNNFLALNQMSPAVARIAPMSFGTTSDRNFTPPLRMLLVLAAADISAINEWNAILKALSSAKFPISVQALVAENDVLDAIATAAKSPPSNVTIQVQTLADLPTLQLALQACPHLTHFFCHGQSAPAPQLRFATPADWFKGPGQESIVIRPIDLTQFGEYVNNSWLVSLSSCETAMTNSESLSFVRELVRLGFPAVLGMREKVTPRLAEAFVAEFYREVFAISDRTINAPGQAPGLALREPLEWAFAMRSPREVVCRLFNGGNPDGVGCKEWTLPALYIRRAPLFVRKVLASGDKAKILGRIVAMRGLLDTLNQTPGTPTEVLQSVKDNIDQLTNQLIGA